ncbi:MAG: ubiquinol-cytochrome C chaperone [Rhodospirillaceae bacterium]|nr:ubiquinol-cytochrome C chaperone [Rhodospirillaceae bacterium]
MLAGLFKRRDTGNTAAESLYLAAVEAARRPILFTELGVPDTLDGRYEMVALHTYLVLRRLKRDHAATAELAQAVFDFMFVDFDNTLRELGVGDLGVGRRVKQMATGFYGRIAAYDAGMEGGDLVEALRRNAYGTVTIDEGPVARLASYLTEADQALAGQSTGDLAAGRVSFPPVA